MDQGNQFLRFENPRSRSTPGNRDALKLYFQLHKAGLKPSIPVVVAALKSCSSCRDGESGAKIHRNVAESGDFSNIFVATTLVHLYTKCGDLGAAEQVFRTMKNRNVVSWNCIVLGYVESGKPDLALQIYAQMFSGEESCAPNHVTFLAALRACVAVAKKERGKVLIIQHGELWKTDCLLRGKAIHAQAAKFGDEGHIFVANALIDMYATCGSMLDATKRVVKAI